MSIGFLILASAALWATVNAVRPLPRLGIGPLWFPALLVGELAVFHAAAQAAVTGLAVWAGAAGGWPGRAALIQMCLSIVGLVAIQLRSLAARRAVEGAASAVVGAPIRLPRVRISDLLRPFPAVPAGIEIATMSYGPSERHVLDRYRSGSDGARAPALVQVHGGGWTGGRRSRQARTLKHRMARAGWVVFDVEYRTSPRATFPDHLIDVKRAIAWIRSNAEEHGVDPAFVAVTGGSAGGQLAALAALSADPALQPGFESVDTGVQACIPFYGVHDLLDGSGTRPLWPYLATHVLKADPAEAPELWALASPARLPVGAHPPFLVFHGALDSLVRPRHSRQLVDRLRRAGIAPIGYAELPGATHGFDALRSVRTIRAVDAVEAVLQALHARHRAGGIAGAWNEDGAGFGRNQ